MKQQTVDELNAAFWNEPCGSTLAVLLGATGGDAASIATYDKSYFDIYPYLDQYIDFADLAGKKVLEIGLGYGSVAQRLAKGGNYSGLDIAKGPVDWVNHRIRLNGYDGLAQQGSALENPFPSNTFDAVVSIGCLHATGDLRKAISEVHRVLKPGGRTVIMVYNAASYFRWVKHPKETAAYVFNQMRGSDEPMRISEDESGDFDKNTAGHSAPEASLTTKTTLKRLLEDFRDVTIIRNNCMDHRFTSRIPRNVKNAIVGPLFGLDLYATAIK